MVGGQVEDLDLWFEKLVVLGGGAKMGGAGVFTEWKDIPWSSCCELLHLWMSQLSRLLQETVVGGEMLFAGDSPNSPSHGEMMWRSYFLTQVNIFFRCKDNMNHLVLSLVPKFTRLNTLGQDKPQPQDNAIETMANCCHDLQDLDLSKGFKLSGRSLIALAHGCPNLTRLNISSCSAFSDTALACLAQFCTKLKYLNLCGCAKAVSDRALKVTKSWSRSLMHDKFLVSDFTELLCAEAIGHNCHQSQTLNLGWCENVGDVGVMSLAYGCMDLRALDLWGCVHITDDSVIALANNCLHSSQIPWSLLLPKYHRQSNVFSGSQQSEEQA